MGAVLPVTVASGGVGFPGTNCRLKQNPGCDNNLEVSILEYLGLLLDVWSVWVTVGMSLLWDFAFLIEELIPKF